METEKHYLAKYRRGEGSITLQGIDFHKDRHGIIIRTHWGLGWCKKSMVEKVPSHIKGFTEIGLKHGEEIQTK